MVLALSQNSEAESILAKAKEQEQEHDWLGATDSYKRVLELVPGQVSLKQAETTERWGYALYHAARQADTAEEFRTRIGQSASRYEEARNLYSTLNSVGRKLRCDAMIAHLGFWLASTPAEKKRLLTEAWKLTSQACEAFEQAGEAQEYGRTYNQVPYNARFASNLEWPLDARKALIREAVETGEQAVQLLASVEDPRELAKACFITAIHLEVTINWVDVEQRARIAEKVRSYWKRAENLLGGRDYEMDPPPEPVYGWATDQWIGFWEKALDYRKKTGDKLLTALALDFLAITVIWSSLGIEDSDERIRQAIRALGYAEEANRYYRIFSFISGRGGLAWVGAPRADILWYISSWETDPEKKRDLLREAKQAAEEGLKLARDSGYRYHIASMQSAYCKILGSQAQLESDPETKKRLLEEAIEHMNESITIYQLLPFNYWNLGVVYNHLADVKAELAELPQDPETQRKTLQDAILTKETSVKLCIREAPLFETGDQQVSASRIGGWQYEYGLLLNRRYELAHNREDLVRAAEAFLEAADWFRKPNNVSRIAECYWRAAHAFEALGDYLLAAEKFGMAADSYNAASEKIPQLKDFYKDHGTYLEAWCEIEKAKHRHEIQDYASAKEFYDRAASLHQSTNEWRFLAPNYSALAEVEHGEDLSRKGRVQKAIEAFHEANRLFNETKATLEVELSKTVNGEKKQVVASLVKGAGLRREYCTGRIFLEEAKLLDRRGDYSSSSQKYGHAAETFEKLTRSIELERGRMEVRVIATVSRAWEMMTKAEAEVSPELYMKAATLFEEVRELSPNEKAKSLTLGHSRFCRALEAGTRFADTGNPSLHETAIQHLESASKYYLKAGFQDASDYAEATERLFDAYLHMDEAKREKDAEKKAKLYAMTEKVLQASAETFLKARHPAKRQEVLRLMEKVKKERELTLSLTEILHAPVFVSATTAFSAPTPARERAVGLERFEHADLQASVIAHQESLKVGESIDLQVELVNAGRETAQLVRLERAIPDGFELVETPQNYRVSDSHLDLKKKMLAPLETVALRLVLRPKFEGLHSFSPRLLYVDENGAYKSHQLGPIEILVSPIVEFLARCFVADYMRKRLSIEESGWRGLTDISDSLKIPKSQVYGEARYGHTFGKPLETLVKAGIVEYRTFKGKGRGGRILRVRVAYDREPIKRLVDELALKPLERQHT